MMSLCLVLGSILRNRSIQLVGTSADPHFKDEKSEAKEAEEELPTGHLCSMFPQKFSALPLFPFSTLINLLSLSNVGL